MLAGVLSTPIPLLSPKISGGINLSYFVGKGRVGRGGGGNKKIFLTKNSNRGY